VALGPWVGLVLFGLFNNDVNNSDYMTLKNGNGSYDGLILILFWHFWVGIRKPE
jgi:hypothetical protein